MANFTVSSDFSAFAQNFRIILLTGKSFSGMVLFRSRLLHSYVCWPQKLLHSCAAKPTIFNIVFGSFSKEIRWDLSVGEQKEEFQIHLFKTKNQSVPSLGSVRANFFIDKTFIELYKPGLIHLGELVRFATPH